MEWTNEKILNFLELYQMQSCIWDPKNGCHKNKAKVSDAWVEIKNNMEDPNCTVKDLKKKKDSLMSMYRGYKLKVRKSSVSGAGASEIYKPSWFAYEIMDNFMDGIYKCNSTMNTEDKHNEDNVELADDTSINHVTETDTSTLEDEHPGPTGSSMSQQTPKLLPSKRRNHNPPELQQAKRQMDQAFNLLQNIAQPQQIKEEDECSIFGKLVAHKMRKLNEDSRNLMMVKINQLFYDEYHSSSRVPSYPNTPSPISVVETILENTSSIPQELQEETNRDTTHAGYTEVTPGCEDNPWENFDHMSSQVDPTAARIQPSKLFSIYKGPATKLPRFGTPEREDNPCEKFDYMSSQVDPTATKIQPSKLISIFKGPDTILPRFVTPECKDNPCEKFDYMSSQVDPTATKIQPSKLISIFKGSDTILPRFVTPECKANTCEKFDYMSSQVDPKATKIQPSKLISSSKGPDTKLPRFVILKKC